MSLDKTTALVTPAKGTEPGRAANAPFFVIGSVRSGTTLVERILNRHPRLFVPPETFYFPLLERLGVAASGRASPAGLRRLARAYRRERAFAFLDIPAQEHESVLLDGARGYRDVLVNLMTYLSRRAGKPRWGEKTPNHLRHVPLIRDWFPDARFILLVRDGRAVVMSQLKHPNWRRNLLGCAKYWAGDAALMGRLMTEMDDSVLHVLRYEELVHDPETAVRGMCAFLGEAYRDCMIDPDRDPVASGGQDYYRQPWMTRSTAPIDPSRAGRWREEYSPRQLRLVEGVAGTQLEALGYALLKPRAPGWRLLYLREQGSDLRRRLSYRLARHLGGIARFPSHSP